MAKRAVVEDAGVVCFYKDGQEKALPVYPQISQIDTDVLHVERRTAYLTGIFRIYRMRVAK